MSELSVEEARLVAVHRAIKELSDQAVTISDASEITNALEHAFDLEAKEKELTESELKQLILGFVAGVAVTQPTPLEEMFGEGIIDSLEPLDRPIAGGASNQIPVGQESGDPRYVVQSGPQPPEDAG